MSSDSRRPRTRGERELGDSFVLGLVGKGIAASLTPAMQVGEGRAHGLSISYRIIDTDRLGLGVDDLPDLLDWAERLGYDGLNITHPFKQAVVPLVGDLSEAADDLQAVNTIVLDATGRHGRNTDWSGFARAFARALPGAEHDRAVLVGAGGAGVAVGYGLLSLGAAHVAVHDRDLSRAEDCVVRLAKRFGEERLSVAPELAPAIAQAGGVVNATPVGMHGHPGTPVPVELLHGGLWVVDVVYFPLQTDLIASARALGCRLMDGGGMAVEQAVGAFELFTGRAPESERMHRHFAELTA